MQQQIVEVTGNTTGIGILAAVWANVLPSIVSLITLAWFVMLIYEKVTGNKISNMYKKWKAKK